MKTFQSFRLDTANQSLWRDRERVSVTPKAFNVLRYLVEHAGRLITTDELLEAVWPETYVNPELIKKYIKEIRKALGDSPDAATFIKTFPKRGYEFVAPVAEGNTAAAVAGNRQDLRLVGREEALRNLDSSLDRAMQGVRQVVLVTGEAGIGKTALADAFLQRRPHALGCWVARGQCVEGFGGKEPYYPVLEAVGQLLRNDRDGAILNAVLQQAPTWMIQFPSLIHPDQKESLRRDILGSTHERMLREICEALEAISADHPLCLVLEDLHWSDHSTLDFIAAIARRRGAAQLALLGTYRPVDVLLSHSPLKAIKQDLLAHQLCSEIPLEQLEESQIAEYLVAEHGMNEASELAGLVYHHSGGNALFMVAIVHELVKQGVIAPDGAGTKLKSSVADIEVTVPETLQHLLDLQFEQLSVLEQQILKAGSVVGERFASVAIASLLDLDAASIDESCSTLAERSQFLKPATLPDAGGAIEGPVYEFKHSLYRQSVYRKLSQVNRSRLHRKVADQLSGLYSSERPELAAELALHFQEGGDHEGTVQYWLLAAENAARRFAHRDCIDILQHARAYLPRLEVHKRNPQELRAFKLMGDAHYAMGEVAEAARAYEAEVALAAVTGDPKLQINALSRLAYVAAVTDAERGIAASERTVEISKHAGDPFLLARTRALSAGFRLVLDGWSSEDARLCSLSGEALGFRSTADEAIVNEHLYASHAHLFRGEYNEAMRATETCRTSVERYSTSMQYLQSWGEMLTLLHMGKSAQLLQAVRRAIALAQKNGNALWASAFSGIEAWLRTLCFDFEGARKSCEPILIRARERATRTPHCLALLFLGCAEVAEGNNREALRHFAAIEEITTEKFYLHWYWRMQAQLGICNAWLKLDNLANASRRADTLLAAVSEIEDPNLLALVWELKARIASTSGDNQNAKTCILEAIERLHSVDIPFTAWHVHAVAWRVLREREEARSAHHRGLAQSLIQQIAASLPDDEPIRTKFLDAALVREVMEGVPATYPPTASARGA